MNVAELPDGACLRAPLSMLVDAPWGNVRRGKRNPARFEEMRCSIKANGVLQSVTVRPNDADNTLELLAGYGRRDLSIEVGYSDIPVVVKRVDDKAGIAIGLAENLKREDLSVVDEILVSQQYVSLFDADYAEAAKAIGWEERKLRGRLRLNDCADSVLDALGEGKIRIGHAEVLCQFTETLQSNTLSLILDEGWTVDYLKERANKATRLLRHAKFDTTECRTCPHNSDVQGELFDNNIGTGKCGNLPCYRAKTETWLERRKNELEKEEGVVLLAVEKPITDRKTVSAAVVGEKAFTEECLGCPSRIRILQDGINKDCGKVTDDQCINLACFREKVDALRPTTATDSSTSRKKPSTKGGKRATRAARGTPVLTSAVRNQSEQFVRTVVGKALLRDERYGLAVTLAAICQMTGYRPAGAFTGTLPARIANMMERDKSRLEADITAALTHGTTEAGIGQGSFDGTRVVLGSCKHVSSALEQVINAWSPTKDWLANYQKGAIEGFCRQKAVGFAAAFDATHGKGAFGRLMKQKKDNIISTILAFNFDWTAVAPKEVRDLVK